MFKMNLNRQVCLLILLSTISIIAFFLRLLPSSDRKSQFWANENIEQSIYRAGGRNAANSSILILYWTTVFGHKVNVTGIDSQYKWPFFSVDDNCPVKCELTVNKSRIKEASAIVIHGRDTDEMPTKSLYGKIPLIFHVNESPENTKALRDEKEMISFSYLATYRLDSDFPCPQFYKPKLTRPVPFAEKTGFSVAVYSNCENVRTLYLHRLMKYIQVDSYGRCLQNKPRVSRTKSNYETLQAIMAKYKFTLVIPNSDCDYYVTEKIYNALSSGSVPVWMGTDKIDEILKWGYLNYSVIKVKNFNSPQKLAEYLLWLSQNEIEYNKFLQWKYKGFNFPKDYYSSKIGEWWEGGPLYCRVCMKIANDKYFRNGLHADRCDGKQRRTLEKWIRE